VPPESDSDQADDSGNASDMQSGLHDRHVE